MIPPSKVSKSIILILVPKLMTLALFGIIIIIFLCHYPFTVRRPGFTVMDWLISTLRGCLSITKSFSHYILHLSISNSSLLSTISTVYRVQLTAERVSWNKSDIIYSLKQVIKQKHSPTAALASINSSSRSHSLQPDTGWQDSLTGFTAYHQKPANCLHTQLCDVVRGLYS